MATNQNANGGQVPTIQPLKHFNDYIRNPRTDEYLKTVLAGKKESFVTSLVSVVTNNTALQSCDPGSIMFTAMKATALGLPIDPNLGFAALIPYRDNKSGKTLAQFQIMRDGWVELLQRTGRVRFIANEPVHEGELVKKNKFTGEFVFDENGKKSDKIIGYMAYVKLTTGFEKTVYWTREECEKHAKQYSQTYRSNNANIKASSLWSTNFDAMALKTVLKHLVKKYMPKSVEIQTAIVADQASFASESGDPIYPDVVEDQGYATVVDAVDAQKAKMRKRGKADAGKTETEENDQERKEQAESQQEQPATEPGHNGIFDNMP